MNKLTRRSRYVVSSKVFGAIALAAASVAGSAASAQSVWTGAGNGSSFSDAANWSAAPVSGTTLTLTFNSAATASNDFATQPLVLNGITSASSGAVVISDGSLSFGGASPHIRQNGSGSLTVNSAVSLVSTTTVAGTGSGAVSLAGVITGAATGGLVKTSTGALNLTGSGSNYGFLALRSGTTNITGGGMTLTSATLAPAANAAAPAQVAFTIGNASGDNATANINGGAQITSGSIFAGNAIGSTANLNISGSGTNVTLNPTTFGLSRFGTFQGTANITVSDGAVISGLSYELGRGTNTAIGQTTVTSTWTGGGTVGTFQQMLMGGTFGARVRVNILDGAQLALAGANSVQLGSGEAAVAVMNIDGGGSQISIDGTGTGVSTFFMSAGLNSLATVNITNGGAINQNFNSAMQIGQGANSTSIINVNGGNANLLRTFTGVGVNSVTTVNITNGTYNGVIQAGLATGSLTTFNVNTGGTLAISAGFIGNAQVSTGSDTVINVNNGGLLSVSGNLYLGDRLTTSSTLVANGGSTVDLQSAQLNIGSGGGNHSMIVKPGATVFGLSGGFIAVGDTNGANGTLLIDGGSVDHGGFVVLGTPFTGSDCSGSTSKVIVQNGGTFNMASLDVGQNVAGTGAFTSSLTVTGTGSTLSQTGPTDNIVVGTSTGAVADMAVLNGATVNTLNSTFVGLTAGSTAVLNVTGGTFNGTALIMSSNGGTVGGTGSVVVGTGGVVNLTNQINIGTPGTVSLTGGTINTSFLANGTNDPSGVTTSRGLLNVASGTLNINGASLTGTDVATGTVRATLRGSGTINQSGPLLFQQFTGDNSAFAGTINVTGAGAGFSGAAAGAGRIFNGANLTVGTDSTVTFFTVNTEGAATKTPANAIVLNSLSIAPTGFVNVVDNDIILKGGVTSISTIRGYVNSWLTTLPADFVGLGTTFREYVTNVSTGTPYTTLAVFPNNTGAAGGAYYATYDGVSLAASDLIVKFTYLGDTNIDGVLDAKDLANVIEGFSTGQTGWQWGDVDYSGGAVNVADLQAFFDAYTYVTGLPAPISFGNGQDFGGTSGAIPEPAALGLLAAAVPFASRRRRRA